jgi:hypothetical protein
VDERTAERARLAALAACLVGSLAVYVMLAVLLGSVPPGWDGNLGFSLPSLPMYRAFTGLPALELSPPGFARALIAALVALWALWGASVWVLRGVAGAAARRRARAIVVAGTIALLVTVVVWVPPALSADLYRQAIHGRMAAHGLNPYALPAAAAAGDPLMPFANQTQVTTTYGAAYTWLSALAVSLAPATPLGAALAWKTMSALAALGCTLLAAPVARALAGGGQADNEDDDDGLAAQLWLGWNPLVVIESAASGHIEAIMMLPALAGILLAARGRPVRGVLALTASTLTKWVSGLVLLLATAREVRRAPPNARAGVALRLAGSAALLAAVLYAPFVRGLGEGAGGIGALALHGAGALGARPATIIPQWAMMAGFGVLVLVVARSATAGGFADLVAAATKLMLVFVVIVLPWLFPWYFIAPLALAAVLPAGREGRWLRITSVALGAGVMLSYARLVPAR